LPRLAQLVEHLAVVGNIQTSQQTPGCPQFKSGSGDHFRWLVSLGFHVEFILGKVPDLVEKSLQIKGY
jgi:hypothetical protein